MSQQDMDRTGCFAGCDPTPRDPATRPTPGQMLHQLHDMDAAEQVDFMQRMLDASDTAVWCFTRDHEGRLAHRDELMIEVSRLRRELEFELCGINVDMEEFFLNVGDRVEFTCPDGVIARGEVVDLDPVRVMADDTGNTTRWPTDLRKARPCSCLTPEGAAVVLAGGFSLPRCAVHPEAGGTR